MTLQKTLLAGAAGAALFAFAAPVATPAEAGSIKNGAATDLTVYGQVSRGVLFYDDGEETGYRHVDADNSSTRFGFKAKGKVNESVDMGAVFEAEMQSNDSNTVSQNSETDSASLAERHMYVYIAHKQFGTLKIGQTSTVSDGMSDGLDLSGAAFAFSGMDPQLGGGAGILFRNDNTAKALSSHTIGNSFTTFDRGRGDVLRYETPTFSGAKIVTAIYEQGDWGAGMYYNNKFGSVTARVTAFYENLSGAGTTGDVYQIGASLKHDSGVSVTGLYGRRDPDSGNNQSIYEARLAYTANMNTLGATGIGINYMHTSDLDGDGSSGNSYGLGVDQEIKNAGANLYGVVYLWDRGKADADTVDTKDIVTFVVGGRVKF